MTGEMSYEDLKDYPQMFEIAKKISKYFRGPNNERAKTAVKPFDVYQGPYVAIYFSEYSKFYKDGRDLGSWNAEIWFDNEDEMGDILFIKYRNRYFYTTLKTVVKDLKAVLIGKKKEVPNNV